MPLPPSGCPITSSENDYENNGQRLITVELNVPWLSHALEFAHHNMKTTRPGGRAKRKYWTKAHGTAFLRSCGFNGRLINLTFDSAIADGCVPYPATWSPHDIMSRIHYAPMHTFFLGHIKRNYEITKVWQTAYNLKSSFGQQANMYLRAIQALRCRKYYDAHPLSTSNWGTGVWVSENYLFWTRAQKFFSLLPALRKSRNSGQKCFDDDYLMVLRFIVSCHACLSCLMSDERHVDDLDEVINIYLDATFEMDQWLQNKQLASTDEDEIEIVFQETVSSSGISVPNNDNSEDKGQNDDEASVNNDQCDEATENEETSHAAPRAGAKKRRRKVSKKRGKGRKGRKGGRKKKDIIAHGAVRMKEASFTNSISLALLKAADAHRFFGPARLHWEGGWSGERKITHAKQWIGIKRSNADWSRISLTKMNQLEALNQLWEQNIGSLTADWRSMEGEMKVYKSEVKANEAITNNVPMSGIVDSLNRVWIAFRPIGGKGIEARSHVILMEIGFDDTNGELLQGVCWCAPIMKTGATRYYKTRRDIYSFAKQYVLMLPQLDNEGVNFWNSYHVLGNQWTERVESGSFHAVGKLPTALFQAWLLNTNVSASDEEAADNDNE